MILTVKSPSFFEFQNLIAFLNEELESAQLQEITATEDCLVMGFYRFTKAPKTVFLVLDLDTQFPFVGLFEDHPWPRIKKTKPMSLFLNSHFRNSHLKSVELRADFGRVADFDFSTPFKKLRLELRIIPKQPNVIAYVALENEKQPKQMSWEKPKDLTLVTAESQESYAEIEVRSIPFMFQQWWHRRAKNKDSVINKNSLSEQGQMVGEKLSHLQIEAPIVNQQNPYSQWVKQREKDRSKKEKALQQIQEQVNQQSQIPWSEIGEYLKTYGYQNFPVEWSSYIKFEERVSHNIQLCFDKMKQYHFKKEGAEKRKEILLQEIAFLQDTSETAFQNHLDVVLQKQSQKLKRKSTEGQFRKLTLADDTQLVVYMGKSAIENMKLLRQAKSWDFWIHLKDYPSAYAILQRNKDQVVADHFIIKAAQWLAKESFRNKKQLEGLKLAVVVTECRHVRPIKGDKLGRVTYHFPRELLISL